MTLTCTSMKMSGTYSRRCVQCASVTGTSDTTFRSMMRTNLRLSLTIALAFSQRPQLGAFFFRNPKNAFDRNDKDEPACTAVSLYLHKQTLHALLPPPTYRIHQRIQFAPEAFVVIPYRLLGSIFRSRLQDGHRGCCLCDGGYVAISFPAQRHRVRCGIFKGDHWRSIALGHPGTCAGD